MELKGLVFEAADSKATYSVSGGQVYRTVKVPGSNRILLYINVNIGPGIPGAGATKPGIPSQVKAIVQPKPAARSSTRKTTVAVP
jgi:hypothetical protein